MPADHIADNAIFPASKMGFGCMRLPLLDKNDPKSIDMPQFELMVDAFMEAGNTYFDTAFVYHEGESEVALGKALVARYPRESFTIATKCLAWALPTRRRHRSAWTSRSSALAPTTSTTTYCTTSAASAPPSSMSTACGISRRAESCRQASLRRLFHTRRRGVSGPAAHRPSGDGLRAAAN